MYNAVTHNRTHVTSNALDTLILHKHRRFQRLSKGFFGTSRISELIWKGVPDGVSGDSECSTVKCAALVTWYVQLVWCRVERI